MGTCYKLKALIRVAKHSYDLISLSFTTAEPIIMLLHRLDTREAISQKFEQENLLAAHSPQSPMNKHNRIIRWIQADGEVDLHLSATLS